VILWTHHAFHWGSHFADEHDLPPRMSIAFEFQRLDVAPFKQPLLELDALPTFEQRLALISMQFGQFAHIDKLGDDLKALIMKIGTDYSLPDSVVTDTP